MASALSDAQAQSTDLTYRALLDVSEAIVSHHELPALFHELAGQLHHVVRFDYLAFVLHEAASNTMRVHVLEPPEPALLSLEALPVGETPAGMVLQTQQPLIISNATEARCWPRVTDAATVTGDILYVDGGAHFGRW